MVIKCVLCVSELEREPIPGQPTLSISHSYWVWNRWEGMQWKLATSSISTTWAKKNCCQHINLSTKLARQHIQSSLEDGWSDTFQPPVHSTPILCSYDTFCLPLLATTLP